MRILINLYLHYKINLILNVQYIIKDGKPRIYIFKESIDKLRFLVSEYFIKEMLYKLGL